MWKFRPERVEIQTESGVFFGNGDWLDLTNDTEVYSLNTVGAAYLGDLLGGKSISVAVRNNTEFLLDQFRIGSHSIEANVEANSSEDWIDVYNTINGRVQYLSFRVNGSGGLSKRVRMNRPLWFGESLQITLQPSTAVVETDESSSEPILLGQIFDPLP